MNISEEIEQLGSRLNEELRTPATQHLPVYGLKHCAVIIPLAKDKLIYVCSGEMNLVTEECKESGDHRDVIMTLHLQHETIH